MVNLRLEKQQNIDEKIVNGTNSPQAWYLEAYRDVSRSVDKYVFRLKISVYDVQVMKVLKRKDYLGCIKSCMWLTADQKTTLEYNIFYKKEKKERQKKQI